MDSWLEHCLNGCAQPADLYSGCRKILRPMTLTFPQLDDSLTLRDAGYTKSKLTMLTKHYLHEESRDVARQLWDLRKAKGKYGSVGFTCYAHFVKGGTIDAKRSKRASVFGPCIQAVTITLLNKKSYTVDVFYRTTELFKKFPADLILLRDVLLAPFDFDGLECRGVTGHFANVTIHPMYAVTILPHLDNPVQVFEDIRKKDKFFADWMVKWTARYICTEYRRGIEKFAQAMRVCMDANDRIDPKKMKALQSYVRKNHPGHRSAYVAPEEDEDGEG